MPSLLSESEYQFGVDAAEECVDLRDEIEHQQGQEHDDQHSNYGEEKSDNCFTKRLIMDLHDADQHHDNRIGSTDTHQDGIERFLVLCDAL